jgi:hypothetical protein
VTRWETVVASNGNYIIDYILFLHIEKMVDFSFEKRKNFPFNLIYKKLKDKIKDNQARWCQHLDRISENRLPVKANKYRPTGTRDLGRRRKRWVPVQAEEPNP